MSEGQENDGDGSGMKEMSWEPPQHPATPGEPVKCPLCLMENLSCSKGVTCAFQVTSTWMSYSSPIVRRAWRALASGWPGSSGWEGDEASGQACWCLPYSTFALSPFSSSSMARMRSRSLISCTPQYVMNQMDKVLTGKPRAGRETWSSRACQLA